MHIIIFLWSMLIFDKHKIVFIFCPLGAIVYETIHLKGLSYLLAYLKLSVQFIFLTYTDDFMLTNIFSTNTLTKYKSYKITLYFI